MSNLHALDAEFDRLTARAIETDKAIIDMLTANNAALQRENTELRELCHDLYARLLTAEYATEMGWVDARLTERVAAAGVEVTS